MAKRSPRQKSASGGIPRTYKQAMERGLKPATVAYRDLSDDYKANFMQMSEAGARPGSLCGIVASPNPGHWLVCYKNENQQCNWVEVPKGPPVLDHDT